VAYAIGFDVAKLIELEAVFVWERHRFANERYSIGGWIAGSRVSGTPEAIDRTQRSSARYFQRPDNDYVSYDPTRTSLGGVGALITFEKISGNWREAPG